jgi:hypothetical protein
MANKKDARIPCSTETRELVKAQKRGGQSYDQLLQRMVEQYNPEGAATESFAGESQGAPQ